MEHASTGFDERCDELRRAPRLDRPAQGSRRLLAVVVHALDNVLKVGAVGHKLHRLCLVVCPDRLGKLRPLGHRGSAAARAEGACAGGLRHALREPHYRHAPRCAAHRIRSARSTCCGCEEAARASREPLWTGARAGMTSDQSPLTPRGTLQPRQLELQGESARQAWLAPRASPASARAPLLELAGEVEEGAVEDGPRRQHQQHPPLAPRRDGLQMRQDR